MVDLRSEARLALYSSVLGRTIPCSARSSLGAGVPYAARDVVSADPKWFPTWKEAQRGSPLRLDVRSRLCALEVDDDEDQRGNTRSDDCSIR